jgi:GT2 family glycosyltransferase
MVNNTGSFEQCPLCRCSHRAYVYSKAHSRVVHCTNCGLLEDVDFTPIHEDVFQYSLKAISRLEELVSQSKEKITFITTIGGNKSLQSFIEKICDPDRLEVIGFESLSTRSMGSGSGSIIVDDHLLDQTDPLATLLLLRERMNESQNIMFLIELVGGNHKWLRESLIMRESPARFWPDWNAFHKLLLASNFDQIWLCDPENVQNGSHLAFVSARIGIKRDRPMITVIMPVFNEFSTFEESINRVLNKEIAGIDIQIIVVESNSTDGTKALVSKYDGHERIKVIWQTKPSGKGYAVREGFAAAKGDIILIQDADLEYDVNDYDALIEELTSWRSTFVLGSRHTGDWKMRKFNDMPVIAHLYNLGHIFFVGVLNFLLGSNMKDPFTMYKVFYRDCINGLNFRYKRFDFDHELVMKLYRKGFRPTEIPVNYEARSFSEGKKVSFFKDGISWVQKDIQLAREPLDNPKLGRLP